MKGGGNTRDKRFLNNWPEWTGGSASQTLWLPPVLLSRCVGVLAHGSTQPSYKTLGGDSAPTFDYFKTDELSLMPSLELYVRIAQGYPVKEHVLTPAGTE